jgi:hypothetical protein
VGSPLQPVGPSGSEGGKDRVAGGAKRPAERVEVAVTVRCADHEVKHRPVVPKVVTVPEVEGADIGPYPPD